VVKSAANAMLHIAAPKVNGVSLLGYGGKLEWTQDAQGLNVKLPDTPPCKPPVALKIQGVTA
jgi:hypothetical protein